MNELGLFITSFILVFVSGIQTLNVNRGYHIRAMFTSTLLVTISALAIRKLPSADIFELMAYIAGAPCGVLTAMWFHKKTGGKF